MCILNGKKLGAYLEKVKSTGSKENMIRNSQPCLASGFKCALILPLDYIMNLLCETCFFWGG